MSCLPSCLKPGEAPKYPTIRAGEYVEARLSESYRDPEQLELCWSDLQQMGVLDSASPIVPVTYINSAAAIKAFVGEHGGTVCTSSNAAV